MNFKHKNVGGCLDLIFGFSSEPDFNVCRSEYLGEYRYLPVRNHVRNDCNLLIRDVGRVN
jgi:hypothetical protein